MRSRTLVVAVLVGVAALVAIAVNVWITAVARQDAAAGKSLADQVAEACARGGPVAAQLGAACQKAAEVQNQATPAPAQVDPDELRAAARAAVGEYCAARNGCRGADGRSPDVEAIVSAVVARIPTPRDGHDGTNGQPGQNASAEQVAAAVAAYCGQASEPCRGPAGKDGAPGADGAQGPQGVSVTDVQPVRDSNGDCQWVVTLHDPATGTDRTVTHPASDAACPAATPLKIARR